MAAWSRKRDETVYLVAWPEHMIVKAGITSGRRWQNFLARDAVLYRLAIFPFEEWRVALDYESELHAHLAAFGRRAFDTRAESEWLLGRLGGHCETFRIPDWSVLTNAPMPAPSARIWSARDHYVTPPAPMGELA